MHRKHSQRLSRRDFLRATAAVAGSVMAGFGWRVAGARSAGAARLPDLDLVSTGGRGTHAWTVGHPFRAGHVPAGSQVVSPDSDLQFEVRNLWPDGSVKFALLSGITEFAARGRKSVSLRVAAARTPAAMPVAEPVALDLRLDFQGAVSGTYALQSVLGVDKSDWRSRAGGGRVRVIPGPVMSEFHYYLPTDDEHVSLWFYVRRYASGATEVETVVENGWLLVPGPGQRTYSVAVVAGGQSRFSGTVEHLHHARWSRVDWLEGTGEVMPRHDPDYLRATGLVPNYGFTSPSDRAFRGLLDQAVPAPFAVGNWPRRMGAAGQSPHIGLLPRWEALYCTSADPRAFVATVGNARASGRYPIHYRDETTGRPPVPTSYPDLTLTSGWGDRRPPAPTGGEVPGGWAITHHPSVGYLAYLLTGRWPLLESLQFSATVALLESRPSTRQGGGVLACINAPLTTRGAAWAWRTMAQAAAASPTRLAAIAPSTGDAALQRGYAASLGDTASWLRRRYVDGTIDGGAHRNTVGWLGQYGGSGRGSSPVWWGAGWMARFQSLALGHASELGVEGLAQPADLVAVRDHSYQGTLRLVGDDASWNWRRIALYRQPYLKDGSLPAAPVFMDAAEAFAAYREKFALPALEAGRGGTLKDHGSDRDIRLRSSSNVVNGFGAFPIAVLAMAVGHGLPGARQKYDLVRSAPNSDPGRAGADDDPTWALVPR